MNVNKKLLKQIIEKVILVLSFTAFALVIYEEGFKKPFLTVTDSHLLLKVMLSSIWAGYLALYFLVKSKTGGFTKKRISELIAILLISGILLFIFTDYSVPGLDVITQATTDRFLVDLLVAGVFLIELSKVSLGVNELQLNPPLIFILSFLVLILIGTVLLMLPNATHQPIHLVDALFTATSAVCVTGLIVLDTAKDFTLFGQLIIMLLFQLGGLGMMTFTSFFGFFFRGSFSIQNQLFLKDFINEDDFGQIFSTLMKIILFTFLVEGVAAVLIFVSLDNDLFGGVGEMIFFSIFHSISGFCNAGFSVLSNGLYEEGFRDNYTMQLVIAFSIIFGGIGFPVVLNYYGYLRHFVRGMYRKIAYGESYRHLPRVVNIGTRLIVLTTGILILVGFVSYWMLEYDHTLAGLDTYGKVVTSFFGAVTPRTAGFNTVDMTALSVPTVLIYLLLMWIGASPGSTGGGLKTSTFAVAILSAFSIAKGKDRVEVFRREISSSTLRKAFTVTFLSFMIIGLAVFALTLFDRDLPLISVVFEAFSAFSTVGLSLGITGSLSFGSKMVLIMTMFIGRVGILTLLIALSKGVKNQSYRYPEESVFIT
ncbi:TrkH family potassium uptake protein [Echinicola vietnamensis]|uniref:Trk-type K+ transport system, membrane component n=1 Tax=Echinicola vietnamensis (strain DSM 17526 / LMG 23754 / KMM 6221) TaxID=926556 RepID=L0FYW0_ECHVK|nr:potassium transporter TrkG [Echinicola vietnamensis]AGA77830.1 Trk-type K+ transport system, membrane component [Echinicola vietnamensis DSM 17526]